MYNILINFALAIGATLATYFFTKRHFNYQYRKEYNKAIVEKRLKVYNYIETQILVLKPVVLDEKGVYHYIFSEGTDRFYEFQQNLLLATTNSLWVTNETLSLLHKLNRELIKAGKELKDDDILNNHRVGQKYYKNIQSIRGELEQSYLKEIPNLYDVDNFFKQKKDYTSELYEV